MGKKKPSRSKSKKGAPHRPQDSLPTTLPTPSPDRNANRPLPTPGQPAPSPLPLSTPSLPNQLSPLPKPPLNPPSSISPPSTLPPATSTPTLVPLNRLSALEVQHHLTQPRNQFAFLADIKAFRASKIKLKTLLTVDQQPPTTKITTLTPLPKPTLPGPTLRSRPPQAHSTIVSPGPAAYLTTSNRTTHHSAGSAPFSVQTRFPTEVKSIPR